jgi:hypothetical protein
MKKRCWNFLWLVIFLLVVGKVGQAQDSLGMHHVATLDYWNGASDIQMVGNLAFVVSGYSGLHIVDLTDPANPVEIGRGTWYDWDEPTGGVYVTGNRAYVATTYGCCAFDISDPTHPVQLARWWQDRCQYDIFVHDTIAIIQNDNPPVIANISDLGNVQQIGVLGSGAFRTLGMVGDYLCMTRAGGGLLVFDISNPSQPVEVARVDTTIWTQHGVIDGNYAYLGTVYDGLRIIDLSNPLQPVEVASCDSGLCGSATVTGTHLVISKYDSLAIWNVADPAHPILESTFPMQYPILDVFSSGNLVCGAYYYGHSPMSVAVVDISNPAAPVQVSSFGLVGALAWIKINGTTGYVAGAAFPGSGGLGICIMNLIDPVNPSFLGIIHTYGSDMAVRGNYAYLTDRNHGVISLDISNPVMPESLHCTPGGCPRRIEIAGDYAYVISTDQGSPAYLYTFSLAYPAVPMQVGSLYIGFFNPDNVLAAQNGYLYLAAAGYLSVFSLADPAAPQLVRSLLLPNYYISFQWDLAVTDHYAYVADDAAGLVTVDISQPENPIVVGEMLGDTVTQVAAIGNMVVRDGNSRINVFDMSDPTDPRIIGYYPTLEIFGDIKILGSYVITTSSELRVYQCDALTNAVVPSEPLPTEFTLLPPYPNPFNSVLSIPFNIPVQKEVIINIYNILGQRVKEFALSPQTPGMHRVLWNSSECASGLYLVRMMVNGQEYEQKVVLLK